MIKVHFKSTDEVESLDPTEFGKRMGIVYLPHLAFLNPKIEAAIRKQCAKAANYINQKWLGSFYAKELTEDFYPDLTIVWLNEEMGYGLVTNKTIPANTYIGEYTGILRKRKWFERSKNSYCFDYTIGKKYRSAYVIDAEKCGNHTRYINHSLKGNLEPASAIHDGITHIIFYTTREVKAGEQLAYDYGENYWKGLGKKPLPIEA